MKTPLYTLHRIAKQIEWNGVDYTFIRPKKNKFGESIDEGEKQITLRGIFHNMSRFTTFIIVTSQDAGQTRTKDQPSILVLYKDSRELAVGDYLSINGISYTLTEIVDINNFRVCCQIILEEVK